MTRLVLNFSNLDIAGFDVDDILSNNGIDIEMADLFNIVLIVTPSNTQSDMDVLFDELIKITNNTPKAKSTLNLTPPPICKEKLFPQKSIFSQIKGTLNYRIQSDIFLAVRLYLIRPEYRLYTQAKLSEKNRLST